MLDILRELKESLKVASVSNLNKGSTMKKLILSVLFLVVSQGAQANLTLQQQQEALAQLEVARAEIEIVKNLIPGFLRKSIGKNLQNADERIAYAQSVLAISKVGSSVVCSIDSSFDGRFIGKGSTEIEAKQRAIQSCKTGSRSRGFFCNESSIACERE